MVTYFSTGAGKFVADVLGIPPAFGLPGQFWAALLMIVLAMVYTVTSGLYGVLVTDLFPERSHICGRGLPGHRVHDRICSARGFHRVRTAQRGWL